ncbi:hypothetical protein M433DRAFT_153531 [Acidomyces richmondensis BFW]|nr:hypothetical protein M433DRAFT_153531 [Acidomyces richmondensis BFW]
MLDEADLEPFKAWVIKKLENISDADSDVLADYVIALVKTDEPEARARSITADQLQDFIGEHTGQFVDEVFSAIKNRSWDPSKLSKATSPPETEQELLSGSWRQHQNLKRARPSYEDHEYPPNGSRRKFAERPPPGCYSEPQYGRMRPPSDYPPPAHAPVPGLFDPSSAFAALLTMQQAMGLPLAQLPADMNSPNDPGHNRVSVQRCVDYDTKGFCANGALCPFEHKDDSSFTPTNGYDPKNAAGIFSAPVRTDLHNSSFPSNVVSGRGRGRTRGGASIHPGRRDRTPQSHRGPKVDPNASALVVEGIPEDNFSEEDVRKFFGSFGIIDEVVMQPYKRSAIVKFRDHDAAYEAYISPKSIFDNRFVKVYWYKGEQPVLQRNIVGSAQPTDRPSLQADDNSVKHIDGPEFDPEEVARRQEEAQKKHEKIKQQREEIARKKREIDQRLSAMEQEQNKMMRLLNKKSSKQAASQKGKEEDEQNKALKVQLAKLQAEAKNLGIEAGPPTTNGFGSPGSHKRFANRDWSIMGRSDSESSYRGAYAVFPGVMRLDNRPKTVSITFLEANYGSGEEAIRQYLTFNSLDSVTLAKHPDLENTALVVFEERYQGEMFMNAAIGHTEFAQQLGRVTLAWTSKKPASDVEESTTVVDGNRTKCKPSNDIPTTTGAEGSTPLQPASMDTYDEEENMDMDIWN